jgi:transposase
VSFAVEGCTGWRYVVEELQRAGIRAHLAEPADTATARGRKRHAKTDRSDARLARDLLVQGRLPECWIPLAHVPECRALLELYHDLRAEHTAWVQRVHAVLFHQGAAGAALVRVRGRQDRRPRRSSGWRNRNFTGPQPRTSRQWTGGRARGDGRRRVTGYDSSV